MQTSFRAEESASKGIARTAQVTSLSSAHNARPEVCLQMPQTILNPEIRGQKEIGFRHLAKTGTEALHETATCDGKAPRRIERSAAMRPARARLLVGGQEEQASWPLLGPSDALATQSAVPNAPRSARTSVEQIPSGRHGAFNGGLRALRAPGLPQDESARMILSVSATVSGRGGKARPKQCVSLS
ncbi:unnamed protein product [Prorocentrum cordatum]|uniref:Uncharacterized protein n=1 Tax=Prorocentrum cordatum TaxID=2364126 RepID=A0ABN9SGT1_9DINO|nr:unnamed protein product [Polarella glacialis]